MTTYYISPNGSDSNNGLGPDASAATNKPWLKLSKAMNTGSGVLPGDTVYIAPGFNYLQNCVPIAAVSSAASPTAIRGDPTNAQGFKDGSGVLLAPAPCWVTIRTSAQSSDQVIASPLNIVDLATNNVKGLQFYDMVLETPQTGNPITFNLSTLSTDLLVQDCLILGQLPFLVASGTPTAGLNLTVRRCEIFSTNVFQMSLNTAAATADADLNVVIEHCLIYGNITSNLALAAAVTNQAGGIKIKGCTVLLSSAGNIAIRTTALRVSTVTPITVEGTLIIGGTPVSAGSAGHVIDSGYNRFWQMTASTNFTVAGTSLAGSFAPQLVWPSLFKWGLEMPRPDIFGWTKRAHANQKDSAWSNTSPDFGDRTARPWGAGVSIGYRELASVALASGKAELTGQGEVSLRVYIPAAGSYTISVDTDSTSYGGTNWPQLIVEPVPAVGLARTTGTATSASSQTVSVGVTTSGAAFLEIRFTSHSTTPSSTTRFDNLTRV